MTVTAACLAVLLLGLSATATAAEPTAVVADETTLVRGGATPLDLGTAAWGPKWAWMGWKGAVQIEGGTSHGRFEGQPKGAPAPTVLEREVSVVDGRRLVHRITVSSAQAQDYTMIAATLDPGTGWQGTVQATLADGSTSEKAWPIGKDGLGEQVAEIVFHPAAGEPTTVTIDPPLDATSDGQVRLVLAKHLDAGERRAVTISVTLPEPCTFHPSVEAMPSEAETGGWFAWEAEGLAADSPFALADWSSEPAGSAGRLTRDGQHLVYAGERFRAWGLNLTFAACAPDHDLAERRAEFYARSGINAVRLHKYGDGSGWAGILAEGANTRFDPEKLERMDHFVARLKERGIFVKLSNTFGSMHLAEEGIERIPYADEWQRTGKGVSTGSGALYLSRELQDLHIEQMVNLLRHTNPHTGLTYAEDPAIMLVELVNEESALFYGTLKQLQNVPTLRARAGELFTDWLLERYGSEQAVRERWGEEGGLGTFTAERLADESFAERRVYPVGNPWFWDPANIGGSQAARAPRLYDAALFLAELQDAFYHRMAAAIRATGYEGLLMASNWQAGSGASHYYNLASDARFDVVDRHNYHGGGASMLRRPGGGSLSSGLQQVADRPFSLSEWIHVFPNQWGAEGPAIIGAYGLGLQGWDISFLFQNRDEGRYSTRLGDQKWDVTAPQVMAPFPAIARQVRRGDVATSDTTAWIEVHYESLHQGRLGVEATTEQGYDEKTFDTDLVPAETLAVQRVAVRYVDQPTATTAVDLAAHRDDAGALVSTTGQLRWMPGDSDESGWFTIDSPATKAVVGFAAGTRHELGGVVIAPRSRFGLIYLTAATPEGEVASDQRLLLVASARAHNRDMRYIDGRMLTKGGAPVLMEPVVAEIEIERPGPFSVHVCDHAGRRSGETLPVTDGRFTIDGRETRTIYYELVFGP